MSFIPFYYFLYDKKEWVVTFGIYLCLPLLNLLKLYNNTIFMSIQKCRFLYPVFLVNLSKRFCRLGGWRYFLIQLNSVSVRAVDSLVLMQGYFLVANIYERFYLNSYNLSWRRLKEKENFKKKVFHFPEAHWMKSAIPTTVLPPFDSSSAYLGIRLLYPMGHPRKARGQSGNCHRSFRRKICQGLTLPSEIVSDRIKINTRK
jgi:hypothetical protein